MENMATMNTMEQELEQGGAMMVSLASRLTITTHEDYDRGSGILKEIKARMRQVKAYWKEPKAAADAAHKTIVARENQMLKPLQEAETTIKKAMLAYDAEVRRKRMEAEAEARRKREEEVKRMEALAAAAEKQGDDDAAEVLRDMAEDTPMPEIMAEAAPTSKGLSVRSTWKARVTDPRLVPAYFNGVELRTINMTALNTLARLNNGALEVPGVEFYEEATMSVRA